MTGRNLCVLAAFAAGCGRVGFSELDAQPVPDAGSANDALPCPATYTAVTGHCYRFSASTETWLMAEQLCEGDAGAHLAVIDDAAEGALVETLLVTNVMWVGTSDRIVEGDYRTVTAQTTYVNWEAGFPTATPDCVEMAGDTALFKTLDCATTNEYLCESDGLPVVTSNF